MNILSFRDCKALQKLIFLGDNITSIGKYAFANCSSITYFDLPSQVTEIKEGTFNNTFGVSKRVEMYLANVITIADKAFINSHIYKLTLPKVEFIGRGAFSACNMLVDVTILTPNTLVTSNSEATDKNSSDSLFFASTTSTGVENHVTIHVPKGLRSLYLTKAYWAMYSDILVETE